MRIGIFTETYTPYISGLVTSEVALKTALEKKGHEVYVVTANLESYHYTYDEKEHVLRIPGIPTGIYNSRLTSIYPIQAVNKIKSWKLDVIHSQTEFAIGLFARLFAKQFNIPLVHTYHTMYEDYIHYITHGYFDRSSKKILEYLTKFYCDKTASELIVPTNKTYKLFKEKYKFERNIHIVPTGMEVERFFKENIDKKKVEKLRKRLNITKKDIVIIFVGRLGEEKNVDFLLKAQKKLNKKIPHLKLLIVGDGPDKEKFEKMCETFGITQNVIFTGKVAWEEIPNYYQLAHIFATASKTETQGLTIIETMAAGVTPVCINDEAFLTAITNKLNGFIFNTEEEYQDIIMMLSKKKSERERVSSQARIQAEHFSSAQFAENVLVVYRHAIENKNKYRFGFLSKIGRKLKGEDR